MSCRWWNVPSSCSTIVLGLSGLSVGWTVGCSTGDALETGPNAWSPVATESSDSSGSSGDGEASTGHDSGTHDGSTGAGEESTGGVVPEGTTTGEPPGSSSGAASVRCPEVRVLIAPGASLNVRSAATTAADPVASLLNGEIVEVLEEVVGDSIEGDDTWLHVSTASVDGYIAAAHSSCAVDPCDPLDAPEVEHLTYGLHPQASDALVHLGVSAAQIMQTIGGAAASAGTHAQDGTAGGYAYSAATDLSVAGLTDEEIRQYIADLAAAGYAGWYRNPGEDGVPADWTPHIHTIWVEAPMKLSLRNQVRSWMDGRNGLVSDLPYAFHQWPQCVRDAIWERYLEHNPANG